MDMAYRIVNMNMQSAPVSEEKSTPISTEKRSPVFGRSCLGCLATIIFVPVFIFYLTPTSWIIPNEPLYASYGVMFSTEIQPRWRWIEFRGKRALPALVESIKHGQTPYCRSRSAEHVGKLKDRASVWILAKSATSDRDEVVRGMATYALGEIGGEAAIEALEGILISENGKGRVPYEALRKAAGLERAREIVTNLITTGAIEGNSGRMHLAITLELPSKPVSDPSN